MGTGWGTILLKPAPNTFAIRRILYPLVVSGTIPHPAASHLLSGQARHIIVLSPTLIAQQQPKGPLGLAEGHPEIANFSPNLWWQEND